MNLSDFREDYRQGALDSAGLDANPLAQFESWFRQATGETAQSRWRKIGIALYKLWSALRNHRPADINAMTLATVDASGKPSTRTVLLKGVDARGFLFFTNYDSRKGRELAANPNAALTFFWPDLERQVCVAGTVAKLRPNPRRISGAGRAEAALRPGPPSKASPFPTAPLWKPDGANWKRPSPRIFPCPPTGVDLS